MSIFSGGSCLSGNMESGVSLERVVKKVVSSAGHLCQPPYLPACPPACLPLSWTDKRHLCQLPHPPSPHSNTPRHHSSPWVFQTPGVAQFPSTRALEPPLPTKTDLWRQYFIWHLWGKLNFASSSGTALKTILTGRIKLLL